MTTWSDRAQAYRESPTHREGPDLDLVVEWCEPADGIKAPSISGQVLYTLPARRPATSAPK